MRDAAGELAQRLQLLRLEQRRLRLLAALISARSAASLSARVRSATRASSSCAWRAAAARAATISEMSVEVPNQRWT
ncbi:hypothetical protein ACFQX4_12625 [Roseomonas sp. GCM10028921]